MVFLIKHGSCLNNDILVSFILKYEMRLKILLLSEYIIVFSLIYWFDCLFIYLWSMFIISKTFVFIL